jgi:large repetitive protein
MRTVATTVVAALLGALVTGAPAAHAATYSVNSTADAVDAAPGDGSCATAAGACTLRAAVQEANAHGGADVVTLPPGLYLLSLTGGGEDLAATGDLDVTEALEVNGGGRDTTIVDGLGSDRIFEAAAAQLTVRDLRLRRGAANPGGAVSLGGPMNAFERVTFLNNLADAGGAIAQTAGSLQITDCAFEKNSAQAGGALVFVGTGGLTIADSTFTSNVAQAADGGAVRAGNSGILSVTGSTFADNIAATTGGALYSTGAPAITLSGSTFEHNASLGAVGGFALVGTGTVTISDTSVVGNIAGAYGGGYAAGTTLQVTGGEITDNIGTSGFGGLLLSASTGLTVDGTAFRRNGGGPMQGGGLYAAASSGAISLANVEVSENAAAIGGGIYAIASSGSVTLTRARLVGNGAGVVGGAAVLAASTGVSVTDSTIADNVAGVQAAGLYLSAGAGTVMQGTTVSGNRLLAPTGVGGGAFFLSGGPSTITSSTFSGNLAELQGGGAYFGVGTFTVRNATFADNVAPTGSAIQNATAVTLVSSIVSGAAPSHCAGNPIVSEGSNIDSAGTCGLAGAGDQVADPQLGPLADNGGPTLTHQPAPTSPALDAGEASGCPATDQRGQARPADGNGDGTAVCDVGAVEFLDLCLDDPAKVVPGVCGCGVADTDASQANGTADCLINGELKARVARGKAIIAALSGDADPLEAELGTIGESLPGYVKQYKAQLQMTDPGAKIDKLAKKARKAVKKVGKAKAGPKLDKARTKGNTALDALDAAVAPQA